MSAWKFFLPEKRGRSLPSSCWRGKLSFVVTGATASHFIFGHFSQSVTKYGSNSERIVGPIWNQIWVQFGTKSGSNFGPNLGPIWDQIWVQFRAKIGSNFGPKMWPKGVHNRIRFGAELWPIWGQFGFNFQLQGCPFCDFAMVNCWVQKRSVFGTSEKFKRGSRCRRLAAVVGRRCFFQGEIKNFLKKNCNPSQNEIHSKAEIALTAQHDPSASAPNATARGPGAEPLAARSPPGASRAPFHV